MKSGRPVTSGREQTGRPGRQTSRVLDAWLDSRRGPGADGFTLAADERLHEARVYPGAIEGYRLELVSKIGSRGIALVATLLRPDGTVSFQRRWTGLDDGAYAAAVGDVVGEVARLGLCDPARVEIRGSGTKLPSNGVTPDR
jgi:hypothetical protein